MFGKSLAWLKSLEARLDETHGKDISTQDARRRAKLHLLIADHGILRIYWKNLFEFTPGVWRSNQPTPRRLKQYKDMGIKSILNLRGTISRSPYLFEEEACQDLGLSLISRKLSARKLPRKIRLLELLDGFETIEKPFLMHCKSGADRAGLAAALYLLHIEGATIEEARKQLSFKYLHIRSSRTGVLDSMIDAYAKDNEKNPVPIRQWIETSYDGKKLQKKFNKSRKSN